MARIGNPAAYLWGAVGRRLRLFRNRFSSLRTVFTDIYRRKAFGRSVSVSGPGSDLDQTAVVRAELPKLLRAHRVKSMLDAPCGDFHWMKETRLTLREYIGVDVVEDLVARDQKRYGDGRRRFLCLDLATDALPRTDLVLCRDLLVHLSYKQAYAVLRNLKASGAKYLLATTYTARDTNRNIPTGSWRPLNLMRPPFSFPPPVAVLNERCEREHGYHIDKSLGLWEFGKLPL